MERRPHARQQIGLSILKAPRHCAPSLIGRHWPSKVSG
jgi:hypothetical protein